MTDDAAARGLSHGEARLRGHVVRMARLCLASAVAVPVLGLVVATRVSEAPGSAAAAPSPSPSPASPLARPARVRLSAFGTRSSPVVWGTHLGADRNRNAVLVGYETYVGTTVRLAETPDPDDGALAQIALEPQLGRLRRALTSSADQGHSRRGRVLAYARVEWVRGNEAVVVGCVNAAAQRLYDVAGRPVRRWHAGVSVARVRLRHLDGRWQVYALVALPPARCRR